MSHRKQVPQPRACAQCGTTFYTARKGHLHCSSACNTRAWRQRQPAAAQRLSLSAPVAETLGPTSDEPSRMTLAFNARNVGTLAVGTAVGNLLSAGVQKLLAPAARADRSPTGPFPTWPPAELLAAAQPPQWVADPTWGGQLWLTPTTYHGHTLHLYAEAGLPYVLWQAPRGDWRVLTTPAELVQLAAYRPVGPAVRDLQQRYGLVLDDFALGTPLAGTASSPRSLDS